MADLIDRQAAIDVIDKILPSDPMKNEYTQGITCGAALAMEYVKQLPPAQPEQRWIPVSEKLPEDFQQVLVWYEYWHWKAEELKPEYGIGWRFRGLWCGDPGNGSRLRVIAWRPLPEPPEEEQDE